MTGSEANYPDHKEPATTDGGWKWWVDGEGDVVFDDRELPRYLTVNDVETMDLMQARAVLP